MAVKSILDVDSTNTAIRYIAERLEAANYRGLHKSQHNRYDMAQAERILRALLKHSHGDLMQIRTTDISRRAYNTPEEAQYAAMCNEVAKDLGKGTQDAMRKNFFLDFHRMGLIDRFNKKKLLLRPSDRACVKYVRITELGRKFLEANALDQAHIYSAAIDKLLEGAIDRLIELFKRLAQERGVNANDEGIDTYEFMFFFSAIGAKAPIGRTMEEVVDLIRDYRSLSKLQRRALIAAIKEYANPKRFVGDKKAKRDFPNWKNETDQIFGLLDQTVYFEKRVGEGSGYRLRFRTGKDAPLNATRLQRSIAQKWRYFERHGVTKTKGFELHHVVPLASSVSLQHFKILDDWRNMVYIDALSHSHIGYDGNMHVRMTFEADDIVLKVIGDAKPPVTLRKNKNVLYSVSNQSVMGSYNARLNDI